MIQQEKCKEPGAFFMEPETWAILISLLSSYQQHNKEYNHQAPNYLFVRISTWVQIFWKVVGFLHRPSNLNEQFIRSKNSAMVLYLEIEGNGYC